MISETEQKRQFADLEFLQSALESAGIETELIPASEEWPQSTLVGLPPDSYQGPEAEFQLMYIAAEGMLSEVALLQIQVYLRGRMETEKVNTPDLYNAINTRSLLGYMGIEEGMFFYRYVYALPRFDVPNEATFLETLGLCFGNFSNFADLIVKIDTGVITATEARNYLQQN